MSKQWKDHLVPGKNYEVRIKLELVTPTGRYGDGSLIDQDNRDNNAVIVSYKAGEFVHGENALGFFNNMHQLMRSLVHAADKHSEAQEE